MNNFEIKAEDFDLEQTLTCGQTFCWHRTEGELYGEGEDIFYTFREGKPIIVEQKEEVVSVETELSKQKVEEALGLHKDLEKVFSGFPKDEKLEEAREEFEGLRIIQDEFFPCLVSYLLSPQMRIPRIKKMFDEISREFGGTEEINGIEMLRFPTIEELSEASEDDLRDIGTGYRAKYVIETLKIINDGFDHQELEYMNYEEAREHMKNLYGVGDKVADCVLLFSKGFHEATPLDTWAKKALKSHYPELYSDDYDEASRNVREKFGDHSGYALEYFFHAARQGTLET